MASLDILGIHQATGPLWLNMTSQPVLDRFALLQSLHVSLESLVVPFHLFLFSSFPLIGHAPWIQPSDGYLSNKTAIYIKRRSATWYPWAIYHQETQNCDLAIGIVVELIELIL